MSQKSTAEAQGFQMGFSLGVSLGFIATANLFHQPEFPNTSFSGKLCNVCGVHHRRAEGRKAREGHSLWLCFLG